MKKILSCIFVCVALIGCQSKKNEAVEEVQPTGVNGTTAAEVGRSLGAGWNLGNQLDAFKDGVADETSWGNGLATQALFDSLKVKGFSTVRIPVTWLGHIGEAPEYQLDTVRLNRVREVVGMAENAGLNVVLNIHHDGADSRHWLDIKGAALDSLKNEEVKAEVAAVWSQIAEALKDKGDFLVFEAFNEIHDGGWGWGANRTDGGKQYAALNSWNQTFVDAVRATGGNNSTRWLSVPSYVTNIDLALGDFTLIPKDDANKVMLAVHFYDPNDFSLTAKVSDWGHTGDPALKASQQNQDEEYVVSQFRKLNDKYVSKGIPVYVGEWGCAGQETERGKAFRNYYLEYVNKAAREAGLGTMYWDNGYIGYGNDKFGLFNHSTGEYTEENEKAIEALIKGMNNDDPAYTLQVIYDNAPVFE